MQRVAGVPGLAVGLAVGGALLLYSGIRGVPIPDALRAILSGGHLPTPPTGSPAAPGEPGKTGSAIADDFARYVGKVKYKWGGADPVNGWDCSGAVTYVLHHDLGYSLPDDTHTVCVQFYGWKGARKLTGAEVVQAGDIVLWPTHMGIAIDSTQMISALNPSQGTTVTTFAGAGVPGPPTFLRVTATPFTGG